MSESKPIASLGPLLLARKGTAKPAMRAQLGANARGTVADIAAARDKEIAASQDDLGWNDMGDDLPANEEAQASEEPEVRRQQVALVHHIADSNIAALKLADNQNQVEAQTDSALRRSAASQGRRAAFTLRLDEARHLRLKLAATIHGESAQQLVTRALDQLLEDMPEIENLAAQVKRDGSKA